MTETKETTGQPSPEEVMAAVATLAKATTLGQVQREQEVKELKSEDPTLFGPHPVVPIIEGEDTPEDAYGGEVTEEPPAEEPPPAAKKTTSSSTTTSPS